MMSICFAMHPCYHITETTFPFYNIPREKDGIAKLGYRIVLKKGNRYTCYNTCKTLFIRMLSTSVYFKLIPMYYKSMGFKSIFFFNIVKKLEEKYIEK